MGLCVGFWGVWFGLGVACLFGSILLFVDFF